MARRNGGFIGTDGLDAPDPPTGVSAASGIGGATVSFTAPTDEGTSAITGFRAQSNDGIGVTGTSSPINVTGLTDGTNYTFNVWAINAYGYSAPSDVSGTATSVTATRMVLAGGIAPSNDSIEYVAEASTGVFADFGDLTAARYQMLGSCASTTRCVFTGGEKADGSLSNVLDYITISSTGNATDFGDRAQKKTGGSSNGTLGLITGGTDANENAAATCHQITIASTGNSTNFAALTVSRSNMASATSTTRAIIAGGYGSNSSPKYNTIDYHTYSSQNQALDFGDLSAAKGGVAGASNNTRAIFGGGNVSGGFGIDTIEYVTMASTGNVADFGDLTGARIRMAAGSGAIFAVFTGGSSGSSGAQQVSFSTLGNAANFAADAEAGVSLTGRSQGHTVASNGHGGIA